jgi:hypothetical protein
MRHSAALKTKYTRSASRNSPGLSNVSGACNTRDIGAQAQALRAPRCGESSLTIQPLRLMRSAAKVFACLRQCSARVSLESHFNRIFHDLWTSLEAPDGLGKRCKWGSGGTSSRQKLPEEPSCTEARFISFRADVATTIAWHLLRRNSDLSGVAPLMRLRGWSKRNNHRQRRER